MVVVVYYVGYVEGVFVVDCVCVDDVIVCFDVYVGVEILDVFL